MTEPTAGEDTDTDRFARAIAIATVLATLIGAAIGYLQSQSSSAGGRASADAQALTTAALGALGADRERAQVQYDLFVQRQSELRRASTALEERFFGGPGAEERAALKLEQERYVRLAERTAGTARQLEERGGAPALDPAGPEGPARDGAFPTRYFANTAREGIRLAALRDAANEESGDRGAQGSSYTVMLTLLAVAVYLFGFSLTPHGRANRRLFASVAGLLTVVATGWAAFVALDVPDRAPDEAAEAFATGRVANFLGDYRDAIRALGRAVELRPTFARALQLRAEARLSLAAPFPGGATTLTPDEVLENVLDDQQRARALGSTNVELTRSLSASLLQLGLRERSDDRLQQAVVIAREAEQEDEASPAPTFDRAVAELALGREEEARAAIGAGAEKTEELDAFARERFVAGALGSLDLAATELGDEAAAAAREAKEELIRAVSNAGSEAPSRIDDIEATVASAGVFVDLPSGAVDPETDAMSVQWYRRDGDLGWTVLPEVSGPVQPEEMSQDPADGSAFVGRGYLAATVPPSCLPATDYRVEVYLGGGLAGTATTALAPPDGGLIAAVDPDIGYGVCRPAGWAPAADALPGLVGGFTSADRTRGVYVARIGAGVVDGRGDARTRARLTFERVLALLFPDAGVRPEGRLPGQFLFLEGEQQRAYSFGGGGGTIRAGFGFDSSGSLLAAIVFGEPGYVETAEALAVLGSVTER